MVARDNRYLAPLRHVLPSAHECRCLPCIDRTSANTVGNWRITLASDGPDIAGTVEKCRSKGLSEGRIHANMCLFCPAAKTSGGLSSPCRKNHAVAAPPR
jgi:hypothetical protein